MEQDDPQKQNRCQNNFETEQEILSANCEGHGQNWIQNRQWLHDFYGVI